MQDWQSQDIISHRPPSPPSLKTKLQLGHSRGSSPWVLGLPTPSPPPGTREGGRVCRVLCSELGAFMGRNGGRWPLSRPLYSLGGRLEAPWAQPWPSVTLSRACPHGPPPCPRAGWARTCLGSTSFASNPGLALCRLPSSAGCASTCPQILQAQGTGGAWRVILVTVALLGASLGEPGLSPSSATCTETVGRDTESLWTSVSLSEKWEYGHVLGRAAVKRKEAVWAGHTVCLWLGTAQV